MGKKKKRKLFTYTKKLITVIIAFSLIDLQLSYILAFIGKDQIAEALSQTIAETIIGVVASYAFKSLLETFFEKREERINRILETPGEDDNASQEDDTVG